MNTPNRFKTNQKHKLSAVLLSSKQRQKQFIKQHQCDQKFKACKQDCHDNIKL